MARLGLITALALSLSACVSIDPTTTASTRSGVPQPPEPYLSRLASMPYVVFDLPQGMIDTTCHALPGESQIGACAMQLRGGSCFVYLLDTLSAPQRAAAIIHERGHCAGWPATHPR